MKTNIPENIYLPPQEIAGAGTAMICTKVKMSKDTQGYTRSDLCVPRSEYDKLKQHADRLVSAAEKALCVRPAGICKNKTVFEIETILKHALAEYRKETE